MSIEACRLRVEGFYVTALYSLHICSPNVPLTMLESAECLRLQTGSPSQTWQNKQTTYGERS